MKQREWQSMGDVYKLKIICSLLFLTNDLYYKNHAENEVIVFIVH